jgi:hypothetical protein
MKLAWVINCQWNLKDLIIFISFGISDFLQCPKACYEIGWYLQKFSATHSDRRGSLPRNEKL